MTPAGKNDEKDVSVANGWHGSEHRRQRYRRVQEGGRGEVQSLLLLNRKELNDPPLQ